MIVDGGVTLLIMTIIRRPNLMLKILFAGLVAWCSVSLGAESRVSHYTCSLNLALSSNDASASIVSGTTRAPDEAEKQSGGSSAKKAEAHHANLIGRGIASCKNEQGFQFNLPAVMAISLNSPEELPLQSLRATLDPVVVDHDANKIFDRYTQHVELRNTPSTTSASSSGRSIVVKGAKNDVLIQINLSLPSEFKSKVNISKVDLRFDDEAPDFRNK